MVETADILATTRTASVTARWRVCLHEAGHAVAGQRLLNRTVKALVFDKDTGAAYVNADLVPCTYGEVMTVAAGPAAELLTEQYSLPDVAPAQPLEMSCGEAATALREQLRESLPDATSIARWCIAGIEKQPDRWAGRCHWIHREASLFVTGHQHQIVEVATTLFTQGIVTLPAEPAREETHHAD